jgi:hypothetical protein
LKSVCNAKVFLMSIWCEFLGGFPFFETFCLQ